MKLYRFIVLLNEKLYKYSLNLIRGISFKHFGKKSLIYKPILLTGRENIRIGNNVKILNGARIEAINSPEFKSEIIIDDGTIIQQDVHITGGKIYIGHNCTIAPRVAICAINHRYGEINMHILQQENEYFETKIGDNCFIGINSCIMPGVEVGQNVIIGANSLVNKSIPPYSVVVGNPAKVIKRYDFSRKLWVRLDGQN